MEISNKKKEKEAKRTFIWCPKCDANIISLAGKDRKCETCGYKYKKGK